MAVAVAAALAVVIGRPLTAQQVVPGNNVNMVSGIRFPTGDPFLQRQNEPSLAVSTRNPLHLLAGANDYRTVDLPGPFDPLRGEKMNADAWLGLFKSFDGGRTWQSTLLPGYPQDVSPAGMASPLKGRQAGTDAVVKAGTNGLFYYAGLAFDRGQGAPSTIFVARFIDHNNRESGDPIEYLGTHIVDADLGTRFLDKTALAVDVPRGAATCTINTPADDGTTATQTIPSGNVYVAYSTFTGTDSSQQSQILFSRSTDCGVSWSTPKNLSIGNILNQNAQIAVSPSTGHVWVSWRRFQAGTLQSDGVFITRSTDGGVTFSKPVRVAPVSPIDQGTTQTSFRTNAFQTMAVDESGRVYVAWPQRGHAVLRPDRVTGDARIVVSTSTNGSTWTTPAPIETGGLGHQIMPTLSFHAGKLRLMYYDLREDVSQVFGQFIDELPILNAPDPKPPRHTIDVYVAQAVPAAQPVFTAVRLSDYAFGTIAGSTEIQRLQYNPPNLPLFRQGTAPFMGDYIDLASAPAFVQGSDGVWRFNTAPGGAVVSHGVWTDNRDVRAPLDGDWTNYTPVMSESLGTQSLFDPTQTVAPCATGQTGMRNQNIYTAKVTEGLFVGSPGNAKPLGSIQRAFVIIVENARGETRSYRLQILNQPPGGQASFQQFTVAGSSLTQIDAGVPPLSTIARTVYVTSTETLAQVQVSVTEIAAPGAPPLPDGQSSTVILNSDPTNPSIQNPSIQNPSIQNPDIQVAEAYNPAITTAFLAPSIQNPSIQNPSIQNPSIQNPSIQNPELPNDAIANPGIINPSIQNPSIQNPSIQNPSIQNPSIQNQDLLNGAIQDTTWVVTNDGNTTASYAIKLLVNGTLPDGFKSQLVLHKTYTTPAAQDCTLALQPHTVLLANIPDPAFTQAIDVSNPSIQNPSIQNATVSLAPGESANVTLRIVDPNRFDGIEFDAGAAIAPAAVAHSVNTEDVAQGITTPRVAIPLTITTGALASGSPGGAYSASLQTFASSGTTSWIVAQGTLPPGVTLDPATGQISGTPTAPGNYVFTVRATDSSGNVDLQTLSIKIDPAVPEGFSRIWNGADSNWYSPKNWSPAGVPTAVDSVYISASIPVMPMLTSDATITSIVVETGATLDTNGFTLTLLGNGDAGNTIIGNGTVVMTGTAVTALGTFPNLTIAGHVFVAGPLLATGNLRLMSGASLNLNGFVVTVNGQLTTDITSGPAPIIIGETGMGTLNVGGLNVDGLTLSRVSLTVNGGLLSQFDNVRFIDYQPQDVSLTLNHTGTETPFAMSGLTFFTVPTTGRYIVANDTGDDGQSLVVNVSASLPGDGSSRSATQGGATVNWLFDPNSASVGVTQYVTPNIAVVGAQLTYTVLVTNGGPATATNVVLNNPVPAGASFVSATPGQGTCGFSANLVSCSLGNIAAGQTVVVTIVIVPGAAGALNNVVSVTASESDPGTSDNAQTVSTPVFAAEAAADLSITKSDSTDPVSSGASFSYSLVVSNAGPAGATNAIVVDILPAGVTASSAMSTKGTCVVAAGTVTCQLGSLALGQQATVTINATASGFGIVTNTAGVFAEEPDLNPANNVASETTMVGATPGGEARVFAVNTDTGGAPGTVSVIDPATNAVTNVITVGFSPQDAALSADGTRLYVTNFGSNSVSVIDPSTNQVIGTIPGTGFAIGIALNSAGTRAYVVSGNSVLVVDTAARSVIASIPVGSSPNGITITPDGSHLYVANRGTDNVSVISTATNSVEATVVVGDFPANVALTPDGTRAYVSNIMSNNVSVIDTSTRAVIATIPVGTGPNGIGVTRDGTQVYVSNFQTGTVSRIDVATNTVVGSIAFAGSPYQMGMLTDRAYVGAFNGSAVRVVDTTTNTILTSIPTGAFPNGISAGLVQAAPGSADLALSLEDAPDPTTFNSVVTFTASITNNGPDPATNVTLTTQLPTGYVLIGTDGASCTSAGSTVSCGVGTIASGDTFFVGLTVRVNSNGMLTTSARVHAAQQDPQINNNAVSVTTTVNAQATTFTVTNINNSGAGSLRDAITLANANGGALDTINFNIPGSGPHTIGVSSALTISDPVVIDGTTQPGFGGAPVIELRGTTTPAAVGLQINAGNSTVRGLVVNGFTNGTGIAIAGNGSNTIVGNFIGTDLTGTVAVPNQFGILVSTSNNTIGGTSAALRNVITGNISGLRLNGGVGNTIQGNYIGLTAAGNAAPGNAGWGIDAFNGTQSNLIGGMAPGAGNVISGSPTNVLLLNASNNTVQGNIIGLNASGTAVVGTNQTGINVSGSTGNQIGGTTAAARNVISGHSNFGIQIANSTGTVVEGNFIGTNANGTSGLGNGTGISFEATDPIGNRIGGTVDGQPNLIAFNTGIGIRGSSGARNAILRNSIHSNGGLGIDLGTAGVTANDAGDVDGGANDLQNFPVLTSATTAGAVTTVQGTLNSAANTTFRLEFFSNSACDASGSGEGQTFVGTINVTTDGSGNASFTTEVPASTILTATATDPNGNTSEFSQCRASASTIINVGNLNDSGPGSLRQAILDSNASAGVLNTIAFNIAGAGVKTITPNSTLPVITDPVIIDGTTQPGFSGTPLIELDGTSAGGNSNGLHITAGNSTVRGLAINRFGTGGSGNGGAGIALVTLGGNTVEGNYLGIDPAGTLPRPNRTDGIWMDGPANVIGGTAAAARNVVSGNGRIGIVVTGANATGNQIRGNFIGTNASGTGAVGNFLEGIVIGDAPGNTVGGTEPGTRNVISGNPSEAGVLLTLAGSTGNLVVGNYIGVDVSGTSAVPNNMGVRIANGASNNVVGGTTASARNIISGNGDGVLIRATAPPYPTNNLVQGNYIGLNAAGTSAIPNFINGVEVMIEFTTIAAGNVIGGTAAGAGNVISGNAINGVILFGPGNLVQGNLIGTNPAGTAAIPNGVGVQIRGGPSAASTSNTIGGTVAGARNVISGNTEGLLILNDGGSTAPSGNVVQRNYVGLNAAGTGAIPNNSPGIGIFSLAGPVPTGNIIGGSSANGNVISGNTGSGVSIQANGNTVQGNTVGLRPDLGARIPNGLGGIDINGSTNTVGGSTAGVGNIVTGNTGIGIRIGSGTGNQILGNLIGANPTSEAGSLTGNTAGGILVLGNNTVIGGQLEAERNFIHRNGANGVHIASGTGNAILFNSIHANALLGINLGSAGVTANDAGDADTGANTLQNFPVLTSAIRDLGSINLTGTFDSTPNTTFRLQFFSIADLVGGTYCDASGNGEGQHYLGETNVTTDGSGNAAINVALPLNIGEVITATATDPNGNTSEFSACAQVTDGSNQPPVANAGPDQEVPVGSTVQLNGGASTDPDEDPLTYTWILNTTPAGSAAVLSATNVANPTFVADLPGTYIAQLLVNDGLINSPSDTVTITTQNRVPIANAGTDQSEIAVGATVTLDGSASSDPDGQPLTYVWSFVVLPAASEASILNGTTATPSFVADRAGLYRVQLQVSDGLVSSPTDTVDIVTVNQAPIANAGADQSVLINTPVQLNGGGSSDPDDNPLSYLWTLVTRPGGSATSLADLTSASPTLVPDIAGTYTVRLVVHDGFTESAPDEMIVTATTNDISMALVGTPLIGVTREAVLQIALPTPAPADGAVVTVTSDDTGIVTVGPPNTVAIPEGASTGQVTLNGIGLGTTILRASASGYTSGVLTVAVSSNVLTTPAALNVPFGQTTSLPISIPQPAPAGGVLVNLVSSVPGIVEVLTATATIPEGALSINATVRGLGFGTSAVTASNPNFSSATSQVSSTGSLNLLESSATFHPAFPIDLTVRLESSGSAVAAPTPGVTVNLAAANAACLSVPSQVTISAGLVSTSISLAYGGSASLPCTTTLTVSSGGLTSETINVTVNPDPAITLSGLPVTVGAGLQTNFNPFCCALTVSLAESQHGGTTVSIESSNPAVALLSADASTAGAASIGVDVPNGTSSILYYVHGISPGTATLTITAPKFSGASGTVNVTQSALQLSGPTTPTTSLSPSNEFQVVVGIPNDTNTGLFAEQSVRAGQVLEAVITNSNATVAQLLRQGGVSGQSFTVTIPSASSRTAGTLASGGVAFDPLDQGATTVSAAISGLIQTTAASTTVTVNQPALSMQGMGLTVGAGLQSNFNPFCCQIFVILDSSQHGGTTVRITSSNPAVAMVSAAASSVAGTSADVSVPNGQTHAPFYIHGITASVDAVTLTATAERFSSISGTVNIVQPAVRMAGLPAVLTSQSPNVDFVIAVGIPNTDNSDLLVEQPVRKGQSITATVTNSVASVARLATQLAGIAQSVNLTIGEGQMQSGPTFSTGGITFDPIGGGSTIVNVVIPGFIATTAAATTVSVNAPAITLRGMPVRVGAGLQTNFNPFCCTLGFSLDGSEHGGVTVTLTSANPAVAKLATALNGAGATSISVVVPNGQTFGSFYVQGQPGTSGTVAITATAPGFTMTQSTVSVEQPALRLNGLSTSTTTLSPDSDFYVSIGLPDSTGGSLLAEQAVGPGGLLTATITNSNGTVAQLKKGANVGQSLTVDIPEGQVGSPVTFASDGIAFDPIGGGTTTVNASIPGFIATTAAAVSMTVSAPGITMQGLPLTVGAGLQANFNPFCCQIGVVLGASQHGGVTVTITSSNPAVALVAPNDTTAGTTSIEVSVGNGVTFVPFYVQAIENATGTVTIQASANGFIDGTGTATVSPAAYRIVNLASSTTTLSPNSDFQVAVGLPDFTNNGLLVEQAVRPGGSLTATISNSNGAVAVLRTPTSGAVQTLQVTIPAGQSRTAPDFAAGGVVFDPIGEGTTTVTSAISGLASTTTANVNVSVAAPPITMQGLSHTVGAGLQSNFNPFCCPIGAVLGASGHGGVTVRITSTNPSIALVAASSTVSGQTFIDVPVAAGQTFAGFYVQGIAIGTANITASVTGFGTGSGSVEVVQPALKISDLTTSIDATAPNDLFAVTIGVPNAFGTDLLYAQPVRPGMSFSITVTNSNASAAQLVTVGGEQQKTVVIGVNESSSPPTLAEGGIAFDPLASGITTVSATHPTLFENDAATVTVQVTSSLNGATAKTPGNSKKKGGG